MSREETLRLAIQGRGAELAREVANDFDSGHLGTTASKLMLLLKFKELIDQLGRTS